MVPGARRGSVWVAQGNSLRCVKHPSIQTFPTWNLAAKSLFAPENMRHCSSSGVFLQNIKPSAHSGQAAAAPPTPSHPPAKLFPTSTPIPPGLPLASPPSPPGYQRRFLWRRFITTSPPCECPPHPSTSSPPHYNWYKTRLPEKIFVAKIHNYFSSP